MVKIYLINIILWRATVLWKMFFLLLYSAATGDGCMMMLNVFFFVVVVGGGVLLLAHFVFFQVQVQIGEVCKKFTKINFTLSYLVSFHLHFSKCSTLFSKSPKKKLRSGYQYYLSSTSGRSSRRLCIRYPDFFFFQEQIKNTTTFCRISLGCIFKSLFLFFFVLCCLTFFSFCHLLFSFGLVAICLTWWCVHTFQKYIYKMEILFSSCFLTN